MMATRLGRISQKQPIRSWEVLGSIETEVARVFGLQELLEKKAWEVAVAPIQSAQNLFLKHVMHVHFAEQHLLCKGGHELLLPLDERVFCAHIHCFSNRTGPCTSEKIHHILPGPLQGYSRL